MIKKSVFISKFKLKYTVIVEVDPETGWYIGQCKQFPGAISQGKTMKELLENMKEAIELVIECEGLTEQQIKWGLLREEAKRLDASVKKNNLTMKEIVAEVKKVRHMRKD